MLSNNSVIKIRTSTDLSRHLSYSGRRFTINTLNFEEVLEEVLKKVGIKAVIIGANATIGTLFIEKAHQKKSRSSILCSEWFSLPMILRELKLLATYISVQEFYEDLKKYPSSENGYYLFYGFLNAKILVEGIAQNINNPIEGLESLNDFDLGIDVKITFNKNNHQALKRGWLIRLKKDVGFENYVDR